MPPRSAFACGSHYACMLAVLDGSERVHTAEFGAAEDREFYATWALKALDRAREYLAGVDPEGPIRNARPEYSAPALQLAIEGWRRQALALLPACCLRNTVFFLVPSPFLSL